MLQDIYDIIMSSLQFGQYRIIQVLDVQSVCTHEAGHLVDVEPGGRRRVGPYGKQAGHAPGYPPICSQEIQCSKFSYAGTGQFCLARIISRK